MTEATPTRNAIRAAGEPGLAALAQQIAGSRPAQWDAVGMARSGTAGAELLDTPHGLGERTCNRRASARSAVSSGPETRCAGWKLTSIFHDSAAPRRAPCRRFGPGAHGVDVAWVALSAAATDWRSGRAEPSNAAPAIWTSRGQGPTGQHEKPDAPGREVFGGQPGAGRAGQHEHVGTRRRDGQRVAHEGGQHGDHTDRHYTGPVTCAAQSPNATKTAKQTATPARNPARNR